MRILTILNQPPLSKGYGGNHRSYQIFHDLKSIPEIEYVLVLEKDIKKNLPIRQKGVYNLQDYIIELSDRMKVITSVARYGASRYRLLSESIQHYSHTNFNFSLAEDAYLKIIQENSPIDICIIDHVKYLRIAEINYKYKIPTWLIPHNFESLDNFALLEYRKNKFEALLLSFYQELETLARCQEILAISRNEAWILNGLDLPAKHYPYLPVGEIRDSYAKVRQKREENQIEQGLFLLIGSYVHRTAGNSMKWLLDNVKQSGLPTGCKVLVIGKGTEILKEEFCDTSGIEILGWLDAEDLLSYMSIAKALLAPQFTGFGAVTRISEAASAGIPLLVSDHAVASIDPPPGIVALPNEWEAWSDAIYSARLSDEVVSPDWNSYKSWEKKQPKPLEKLIMEYKSSETR